MLFCDLVGSTAIAAQLDPEEWRETVAGYHRATAEAITRFGGHVAKYLGDGVMAFFGYPEAHDNDAERAARAGLAIVESVAKLDEHSDRRKLVARVGIHAGGVVVGASAGHVDDVFGDTPNIASRVQEVAAPGTVLITDGINRLASGLFKVEDRGSQSLKGIEQPVHLYQVIKPSGTRGRPGAGPRLTPFIGREDELSLLIDRWKRVGQGEGQLVTVVGDPGIGKSRLVRQFHQKIAGNHIWIESAGDQLAQSTPFYAVAEMLRQGIGARGGEAAETLLELLAISLEAAGLRAKDALPLIAPLLNLSVPKNYPPVPAVPEEHDGGCSQRYRAGRSAYRIPSLRLL